MDVARCGREVVASLQAKSQALEKENQELKASGPSLWRLFTTALLPAGHCYSPREEGFLGSEGGLLGCGFWPHHGLLDLFVALLARVLGWEMVTFNVEPPV